ncbi:hypothetical protein ANCDUO_20337 [Ancylostoma duodenale]|uniref:SCP domain-containing protein n=1 Tax=Ancylostoma duodenale TaxID=51022 RepID=A0A0C2C032_9BILA|nr:hypothetical protein ANCDUO_20337 [Ancylostoma duodenale]
MLLAPDSLKTYDCSLEEGAIAWAAQCPRASSPQSFRPGEGENCCSFPATRFNFDTATKKSVTEWWKPIRDVNYFEKVVVFRPFHEGTPISTFTQFIYLVIHYGCLRHNVTKDEEKREYRKQ